MTKKYLSRYLKVVCLCLAFLFYMDVSFAAVISEINFDPAGADDGREWVEVFNDSNTAIKLTDYKFVEGGVNHGISALSGDSSLNSGEYAVIIQDINKFKLDFPTYVGKIFKASFSLSNTGEQLSLKDANGNVVNSVNYSPVQTGAGNGMTINFDGTNYVKGSATPGVGNLIVSITTNTNTNASTSATSTQTTATTTTATDTVDNVAAPIYYYRSYWPAEDKVYVYAGENKIGLSGGDIFFQANAQTGDKQNIPDNTTNYFWSFGDGTEAQGRSVRHAYEFPGEYVVDVQAYANGNLGEDKIYVEIFDPDVKISLQNLKDQKVIQISNNSNNEIDLGHYLIESKGGLEDKIFTIGKKLSILPKKSISLSQDLVGFATDTNLISLNYPNGKIISDFHLVQNQNKQSFGLIQKNISNSNATSSILGVFTREDFDKQSKTTILGSTTQATSSIKHIAKIALTQKTTQVSDTPNNTVKASDLGLVKVDSSNTNFVVSSKNDNLFSGIFHFLAQ